MLPLSVLKKMRVSYRSIQTKDLQNLLDSQKMQLKSINLSTQSNLADSFKQKIHMIEEELKNREQTRDYQL